MGVSVRSFEPGQTIEIPCSIGPGAFVGERYVTIHLEDGEIAGFVPRACLTETGDHSAYIPGRIEAISGSMLTIRVPGSYFTTTGVADISQSWAERNTKVSQV